MNLHSITHPPADTFTHWPPNLTTIWVFQQDFALGTPPSHSSGEAILRGQRPSLFPAVWSLPAAPGRPLGLDCPESHVLERHTLPNPTVPAAVTLSTQPSEPVQGFLPHRNTCVPENVGAPQKGTTKAQGPWEQLRGCVLRPKQLDRTGQEETSQWWPARVPQTQHAALGGY